MCLVSRLAAPTTLVLSGVRVHGLLWGVDGTRKFDAMPAQQTTQELLICQLASRKQCEKQTVAQIILLDLYAEGLRTNSGQRNATCGGR